MGAVMEAPFADLGFVTVLFPARSTASGLGGSASGGDQLMDLGVYRANLEGPERHARVLRHQRHGMLHIRRLQDEDPADMLLRLGEGTIAGGDPAALHAKGDGLRRALEGLASEEVPAPAKLIVVGEALLHRGLPFSLGHRFPGPFVEVPQADELHGSPFASWFRRGRGAQGATPSSTR